MNTDKESNLNAAPTALNKNTAPRQLGRGLAALLGNRAQLPAQPPAEDMSAAGERVSAPQVAKPPETAPKEFMWVKASQLRANPHQPRKHFHPSKLEELAQSIQEHGILQPILVRTIAKTSDQNADSYEIIAGERRWRAAQAAGLDRVPVVIKDEARFDRDLASIVENLQRENLSPVELAQAYDFALKSKACTQEALAERLGVSRVSIANTIRLLSLPEEIKKLLNQRLLSEGHARALLGVDDRKKVLRIAEQVLREGLSVREVERLVKQKDAASTESAPRIAKEREPNLMSIENEIRELFATKVALKGGPKRGKIEIYFDGADALDRIVSRLREVPQKTDTKLDARNQNPSDQNMSSGSPNV